MHLYYLDSKVIPDSVAPEVARGINMICFQRDVFIDNELDPEYIKKQIRKAIRLSEKKGYSIATGHAKNVTLETIREMTPEIISKVNVVKLSQLK